MRKASPNDLKEALTTLGYYPHPALKDGRVNIALDIDNGAKSRLYVHEDSPLKEITLSRDVSKAYLDLNKA